MDKSYTRMLIEDGLKENSKDIRRYEERLSSLLENTSLDLSAQRLQQPINKIKVANLEAEADIIMKNIVAIKTIFWRHERGYTQLH